MNYLNTNGQASKASLLRFCAVICLILCGVSAARAQTTAFTYQGKLTDAGNPANANYDLQFKLFDTVTVGTGAQQGATLVRNPVTASAGVFTVTLDFGPNVFSSADRYLEIGVRPSNSAIAYTVLSPRQPINSTPYAIRSMNSTQLGGVDASQYVTTSSVGNAFIKNDTALQSGANMNISGNGFFGGNIGIGTTTPLSKLAVQATGYGITQTGGAVTVGTFITTAAGGSAYFGTKSNHPLNFFTNDGLPQMTVDTTGNVGIGISPTNKLHVLSSTPGLSAIYGESATGRGVWGKSTSSRGVYGESTSLEGVYGISSSGTGVSGASAGVGGFAGYFINTGGGHGVYSETTTGRAIWGKSISSRGVYGESVSNVGVWGVSSSGQGVIGNSTTSNGVDGSSASVNGYGGHFINTAVGGKALRVDGTGSLGVLEITNGSDLAEKFEVEAEAKPGMVVAIDPENPGKLSISRGAYNRRVAGIISGANNLSAGMVLPNLVDVKNVQPVALSGRVWVYCDVTKSPIKPGDLLTTAATAGHAMKVVNHVRAQGAIIGKAMTELKSGKGLVLVLVTLQ